MMKKMLTNALNNTFFVETLHKIGFHTIILMISTFPSTVMVVWATLVQWDTPDDIRDDIR